MITSAHKLIATLATAAALLMTSAALAKAPTGGRPGQTGNTTGKGSTTTTTLTGKNKALGEQKEQHLKAESKFREASLERAREKEQLLKDKNSSGGIVITHGGGKLPKEPGNNNSGSGIVITHGGGKLPKEPGNNPDKGCNRDCNHDCDHYCSKDYCHDRCYPSCYTSFYTECPAVCVEPVVTSYVVLPGETFATISTKLFGNLSDSANIAMVNSMPVDAILEPGQTLMLPSVGKAL